MTSDQIKRIRTQKKLTQKQFAKLLGVSWRSVQRWENGTKPHPVWVEKMRSMR